MVFEIISIELGSNSSLTKTINNQGPVLITHLSFQSLGIYLINSHVIEGVVMGLVITPSGTITCPTKPVEKPENHRLKGTFGRGYVGSLAVKTPPVEAL